jgi:hypothetical protein
MKLTGMVIALVLVLGAAAGVSAAEFTEAELYFELNKTE